MVFVNLVLVFEKFFIYSAHHEASQQSSLPRRLKRLEQEIKGVSEEIRVR